MKFISETKLLEFYRKLIEVRMMLDENLPKGKQMLTNLIREIEDELNKGDE